MKQGPVDPSSIRSPWARLAFFLLSVFWAAAGWMVLLQGGFHSTRKYSRETTFVDGPGGVFMACVFLMLATIAAAVLMRSLGQRWSALVVPALIFLLPPCIFLFRH